MRFPARPSAAARPKAHSMATWEKIVFIIFYFFQENRLHYYFLPLAWIGPRYYLMLPCIERGPYPETPTHTQRSPNGTPDPRGSPGGPEA